MARIVVRAAAALVLAWALVAQAQEFARPVRIIVPVVPGGPTDVLARLLAPPLAERWGTQVLVDNRPGAGQMIGVGAVAKAPPDGSMLVLCNDGPVAINASLYDAMPYDPARELTPLSLAVSVPLVLVVHPALPANSVGELVAWLRAHPGRANYASGGSVTHLAAELFRLATSTEMLHVPYKGSGQAIAALIAGETQLMFDGLTSSMPHARAGKLRALAVTAKTRVSALPEIPTVAEAGVPGYEAGTWLGLLGPGNIPSALARRIAADVAAVLRAPGMGERLAALGLEPVASSPEEFARVVRDDSEKWARVIREARIPKIR